MKKLAVLALVPAAVAALAVPAGAAVSASRPTYTIACPDGPGTARVWVTVKQGQMRTLAADNPCDQWLTTILTGSYGAGVIGVEPGAHLNRYGSWRYTAGRAPACRRRRNPPGVRSSNPAVGSGCCVLVDVVVGR